MEKKKDASSTVSLKLLVDRRSNRVLFGEAGKEFVDFLCSLLSLHIGTVIKLLKNQGMVGSLGNFYRSIENISETYLQPNQTKNAILETRVVLSSGQNPLLLLLPNAEPSLGFYGCPSSSRSVRCTNIAKDASTECPRCGNLMSVKMTLLGDAAAAAAAEASEGGFVRGVVTYMVMDDLEVRPMSTISSITLLNRFGVTDVGALEEIVFNLTMNEGVNLLKTSLHSRTVLTDVFLKKTGS